MAYNSVFSESCRMDGRFQTEEESMTCFMCKGAVKDGFSTFTADMGDCVVVIKNVPSGICEQCGETSYVIWRRPNICYTNR